MNSNNLGRGGRNALRRFSVLAALPLAALAACSTDVAESASSDSTTADVVTSVASTDGALVETAPTDSATSSTPSPDDSSDPVESGGPARRGDSRGGPGGGVDVAAVSTVDDLVALIQSAYGDAGLGLHRGHQPVQDVLDEVLTISHDELHVRMDAGQNLAAVADDLGVGQDTLIDALTESWGSAIDELVDAEVITADEAAAYEAALRDAFTFRVTWNGVDETPTFDGLA